MTKSLWICLGLCLGLCYCRVPQIEETTEREVSQPLPPQKRPIALENGKFIESAGRSLLYGGEDSSQHFDVSNLELKPEQFHYGIGREKFPALLEPQFISVEKADVIWADTVRFLVAHAGEEVKAYAVPDLIQHEVVNDVLDGKPIMAAYCILADLGAVYERQYGEHILTFALSGYTYFDPQVWEGQDGFVLWDRETESLWWPLIGKAVSGKLKGVKLQEMDKAYWEDTEWAQVKEFYPHAQVLKSGQDFDRPQDWPPIEKVEGLLQNFQLETSSD